LNNHFGCGAEFRLFIAQNRTIPFQKKKKHIEFELAVGSENEIFFSYAFVGR
jgi:hypothetical protein